MRDYQSCNWIENNVQLLSISHWRASLVPAAAVIPALRAYIKVVAFKTPVVEIAWSGVQRGDRKKTTGKEMQYASCSSALREKRGRKAGRRESVCTFIGAFKFSANFPLPPEPLSRGVWWVCEASLPCLFLSDPLWVPALSFVTIKKLECL